MGQARFGDGYGFMPLSAHDRTMTYTGEHESSKAPIQLYTISSNAAQIIQMTVLNKANSATGYSILANRTQLEMGETAKVTVSDAAYVTSYRLHVMQPDGNEFVIDNGCSNVFEFTVEQNGLHTAYAEVSSPVSLYSGSMTNKSILIQVGTPVSSVLLNKTSLLIEIGKYGKLNATVLPENATNKNVSWSSSNPVVVKVLSDGTILAQAEGQSIVTVTTKDGGYTASCTVSVGKRVRIIRQPTDATAATGVKALVPADAEGEGLKYQWYLKNVNATRFSKSSITKATYSVAMSNTTNDR